MRRKYIFIIAISTVVVCALLAPIITPSPLDILQNWGLVATILVILTILALFLEFEETKVSSKEIALISMLGTLAAASRIPFAAIPSAQPATYLIICSGYIFGPIAGFMIGAITPLVSNFFLGHGPWTIYQMLAWGLVGNTAGGVSRFHLDRKRLIAFGIIWGYLFGMIMNLWFWAAFVYPLTPKTFLISQLNSIWFDTAHALTNALFLGMLGPKTITILDRFRKRFQWDSIQSRLSSVMFA